MFAWITQRSLTSEKERIEAEAKSLRGERIRLSLARMDGIGSDLIVAENLRAPVFYRAYFSPSNVLTNHFQYVEQGVVLQLSPLLVEESEFIELHFELNESGRISSPQVPSGNEREWALASGLSSDRLKEKDLRFAALKKQLPEIPEIASMFGEGVSFELAQVEEDRGTEKWMTQNAAQVAQEEPVVKETYEKNLDAQEQASRSRSISKRVEKAAQKSANWDYNRDLSKGLTDPDGIMSVSPFLPIWNEGELFFVREVRRMRSRSFQGFWIAGKPLEKELMSEVPSDLKEASLVRSDEAPAEAARLVSLPWALLPGETPEIEISVFTPLRKTLAAGWVAALIALAALYLLLAGVLKLSARRAAFVSSVTHELRTPLTTFRLYSEMLADGMVTDEEKKQDYLRTMQGESERLNHLVENVLSYSRIERGNARSKLESLAVPDLVERMRQVLQRRVDQENAALSIEMADNLGQVETDVTAVEQILFNLIDNACKYRLPEGESGKVTLSVRKGRGGIVFEVRDEGRGIDRTEKKRLFRAFHKSAHEAAHDKPGVGLGLALCRRLARALGGELKLGEAGDKGASFVLVIP
ncbi:HAMP domain-containing histidine kinase [Akkermansiaceae bacterium]|nr:HAMP domain-containing histidine kinase [Akkermansiaceae bacterium]